ncbi:hypothetical protein K490DRAFT_73610 [Saccharata proteae CBS 121410]|uniref:DUF1365-domain-containing protein n=1 Tax=Saccharata proteae CBS 121410 TaxID=1314787 RepID=A0A9P4HXH9_9PEZI|nr:hypothetical protein K490DRAFT_73610 [Saccharata proteae CBS 121410]
MLASEPARKSYVVVALLSLSLDVLTECFTHTWHINTILGPALWCSLCRTAHSRFFPQKHSFSYSYLCVGVPVGQRNKYGNMLSVDTQCLPAQKQAKGWFHVQGEDHLERGGSQMDLKDKLSQYLQTQGVCDDMWHHAYLVTAPRFLGYSFNPVSFWYIYTEMNELKMMILEVNNTFDERRLYLLEARSSEHGKDASSSIEKTALAPSDEPYVFQNSWPKDFHVSPFNSREGSYSLSALDPFDSRNPSCLLHNDIDLLARQDGRPKINARIFSEGDPVDPTELSALGTLRFLATWWWVGLVTFPRIVRQAYALYFKRRLRVFFRPEVATTSMARNATSNEIILETFFIRYLEDVVAKIPKPIIVRYEPAAGTGQSRELKSASVAVSTDSNIPILSIKIMGPAFYSRFVHYSHTWEAFNNECLCTDPKNATISFSNPSLLNLLPFDHDRKDRTLKYQDNTHPSSYPTPRRWRWTILKKLRCHPAAPSYLTKSATDRGVDSNAAASAVEDIRSKPFAPLDGFVQRNCQDEEWLYRRCAAQLFLAQRLAGGFTELIALVDIGLRCALLGVSFQFFNGASTVHTMLLSAVHIWSFAKGL